MEYKLACWLHSEASLEQLTAIGELIYRTWPKPDKDVAYRVAKLQELGQQSLPRPELASRSFVLLNGEAVVAHASVRPRQIHTEAGPLWIMGLGGVCTDPKIRGAGLGATISRAALSLIDDGLVPFSLFQTSHQVQPFYERLGAQIVENRVFDSTASDPNRCPFKDDVVMRYPTGPGWPDGPIDLCGPGF